MNGELIPEPTLVGQLSSVPPTPKEKYAGITITKSVIKSTTTVEVVEEG